MSEARGGRHSRHRPQWYRAGDGRTDPYQTRLRIGFLDAVDRTIPEASERVIQVVGPAFEALAHHLETDVDAHSHDDLPWSLQAILDTAGRSTWMRHPASDSSGRLTEESEARTEGEDLRSEVVSFLRERSPCTSCVELGSALRGALAEWAKTYHLHHDEWVGEHVFRGLQMHRIEATVLKMLSDPPEPFRLGAWVRWLPSSYKAPDVSKTLEPWPYQPDRETLADLLERTKVYAERVERIYKKAGYETAKDRPSEAGHLRWLVLYHCLGRTYQGIAGPSDVKNVRENVARLRRELPLKTPRPRPPRRRLRQ